MAAVNIIGGSNATQDEFPWQILVIHSDPAVPHLYPFCGGVLVEVKGTQVVLTSGHCFFDVSVSGFTLVAGELKPYEESGFEQYRNACACVINADVDTPIALIIPDKPFLINEHVKPAGLPPVKFMNTTGDAWLTGWGHTDMFGEMPPNMTDHLQKLKLKLILDEECNGIYGEFHPILPQQICTEWVNATEADPISDHCLNDMGGPVYSIEGQYLAAIISNSVSSTVQNVEAMKNVKNKNFGDSILYWLNRPNAPLV